MDGSLTSDDDAGAALRVGAVVPRTTAEGPGARFAVWAQGCTIQCSGCFNPHLWGARGGYEIRVTDLHKQILDVAAGGEIEGITLLGGEPFEQAQAFALLAAAVKTAGLSVMVFSGYELAELQASKAPEGAAALLAHTDLLVDGPYRAGQPDFARPWVGSTNQGFHFLTNRYRQLAPVLTTSPDRIEVRVGRTGEVALNGWASVDQLDVLLAGVTSPVGRGRIR